MNSNERPLIEAPHEEDEPGISFVEIGTWLGHAKRSIGLGALVATLIGLLLAFVILPAEYTAKSTLVAPSGAQGQGGAGGALAALAAAGVLSGALGAKTPDELYVSFLKSDSVLRGLDARFKLRDRYDVSSFERLRKRATKFIHITSDKKSGLITVEVDDEDPKFAADLANAHLSEVSKVLDRLAVTEAQQRRKFFEQQLNETKERLVKAEQNMRTMQEKSGVIVLDRQAEALIGSAAELRARIAEREIRLKVLRTGATEQNPDVIRLTSEIAALRAELQRVESNSGGTAGSPVDIPVGRLPEAALEYIRVRRELRVQETLLEAMVRQFEVAKLDEAKEGPSLQLVDQALPPDAKSKPPRALIVLGSAFLGALLVSIAVIVRRYNALARERDPASAAHWHAFTQAWRWR